MALGVLWVLVFGGRLSADSIYMKTGMVVRTSMARIEDDAVIFEQYGSRVVIPLSLVERVVPDNHTGPGALESSPRRTRADADRPTASGAASSGTTPGQVGTASSSLGNEPAPPEETKEYWQARVRALYQQGEQLEASLKGLRRIERAFLFSHRSTADTRRQIEEVQRNIEANEEAKEDLRREARRKGIRPGWLRVRGVTY